MAKHWLLMLIRGIFAILFALMAFFWTGLTLELLVILLGLYLLIDGFFSTLAGIIMISTHKKWWILLIEGVINIAMGVAVFVWPGVTVLILLYLVAFWAIISGVIELIASFAAPWAVLGKAALALSGIISLILGLVLVFMPALAVTTIIWLIGIYALVFGLALISFSLQIRKA